MTLTIYGLLTVDGTAARETALCADDRTPEAEAMVRAQADTDVPTDAAFEDVSGNDEMFCQVCRRGSDGYVVA